MDWAQLAESLISSPWLYAVLFAISVLDAFLPVVPSEPVIALAGVYAAKGQTTSCSESLWHRARPRRQPGARDRAAPPRPDAVRARMTITHLSIYSHAIERATNRVQCRVPRIQYFDRLRRNDDLPRPTGDHW
ncbi:hypothetical protein [Amycolatopsis sp. lyj-109]|uniref:hypothetical protein n=1 Tax=Amycolatopsis sp. lyj-109 TaxID=2789287 RepID=UPI00397D353C